MYNILLHTRNCLYLMYSTNFDSFFRHAKKKENFVLDCLKMFMSYQNVHSVCAREATCYFKEKFYFHCDDIKFEAVLQYLTEILQPHLYV